MTADHPVHIDDTDERRVRAARLKERVYITFSALAIVMALRLHHEGAGEAFVTLAIGVVGTLLAMFVADVISHIAVHASLPRPDELHRMASTTGGAMAALIVPFTFLLLALVDVWTVETALAASSGALVLSLVVIAFIAVRRVRLPAWQKAVVLLSEFVLGLIVIALEIFAHG